ncbi:hypothetical protein A4A49_02046 [Nicotiana attenuata]|uniref:DUF4283 domain-containing protein n=1 Tax=Nicotiana attenuata TaxID=49451 RepID=A0A314L3P3_NICAT|nr:hypothetical protein A4A49_02046 [Nicotiana attenuata]
MGNNNPSSSSTNNSKNQPRPPIPVSKPSFTTSVSASLANSSSAKQPVKITHGTHMSRPAVYFSAQDFFVTLSEDCKFTIVGKFTIGKPNMDKVRRWDILSKMVISIGTIMAPDMTTYSKSRGNVAKIKVETDLLKIRKDQIWLGFKRLDSNEKDGYWLDIEYEDAPSYCQYCRKQGYDVLSCRNNKREKEIQAQEANKEANIDQWNVQKGNKKGNQHTNGSNNLDIDESDKGMLNDIDSEFEALGEESKTAEYKQDVNDSNDDFESIEQQSNSDDAQSVTSDDHANKLLEIFSYHSPPPQEIDQAFEEVIGQHHLSPWGHEIIKGRFSSTRGGHSSKGGRANIRDKCIPAVKFSEDKDDQSISL